MDFAGLPHPEEPPLPSPKQLPGSCIPPQLHKAQLADQGCVEAIDPSSVTIDGHISASWPASYRQGQELAAADTEALQAAEAQLDDAYAAQTHPADGADEQPVAEGLAAESVSPLKLSAGVPDGVALQPSKQPPSQESAGQEHPEQGQPVTASLALDVEAIIESSVQGILPRKQPSAAVVESSPQPYASPFAQAASQHSVEPDVEEWDQHGAAEGRLPRRGFQHAEDMAPRVSPSRTTRCVLRLQ